MRKALLLLWSLLFIPLSGGCGDSDEFSGGSFQNVNNNFTSLLPNLSGNVGGLQLLTDLEGVNAQSISIVTSAVVPTVVDEFRFLGFNEDGILIYGPVIRNKAEDILLQEVPVEVVNLRIELLADGLIVGGLSTAVQIETGETFVLNNPTFSFPQGAAGPAGPPGEDGSGALGTAYGAYIGGSQSTDIENITVIFDIILNQLGVESQEQGASFQVAATGDYLLTYTLVVDFSELDPFDQGMIVTVNGEPQIGTQFSVGTPAEGPLSFTVSFVLTLDAGDVVSLTQDGATEGEADVSIVEAYFNIVRLGDATAETNN